MASRKGQDGARPGPAAKETQSGPPATGDQSAPAGVAPIELPAGFGRYPVLSPLRFDGRLYGPDDPEANEVVMPRDQAETLQPLKVLGDDLT